MRKLIGIVIGVSIFFMSSNDMFSQANVLNSSTVAEIDEVNKVKEESDKPLEYGYIDQRDILWARMTWEYIDLNEKVNMLLYYPIDTLDIKKSRRSLYDTLLNNIRKGKINEIYETSSFSEKLTYNTIQDKLLRIDTASGGYSALNEDPNADISEYIDSISITAQDIQGYRVKGLWYFDKRLSELKYRLLALAPVAKDVQTMGRDDIQDDILLSLFWVFMSDARDILHRTKVFNEENPAFSISYDLLLNARKFNGLIYRVDNMYGNRDVNDYIKEGSFFQVLEAERLKDKIRNKELDMWIY